MTYSCAFGPYVLGSFGSFQQVEILCIIAINSLFSFLFHLLLFFVVVFFHTRYLCFVFRHIIVFRTWSG